MSQFNVVNLWNITMFDGTYFHVWKHNMKLVLKLEKLLNIAEGIELKPVTPPPTPCGIITHIPATGIGSKENWTDRDTQALTIITNCLEISQVSYISFETSSKDAWEELI
jgi:hypothetical protein